MALIHPRSRERWQDWEASRQPLRRATQAVTDAFASLRSSWSHPRDEAAPFTRWSRGGEGSGRILIAVDNASPASCSSLLAALPYLRSGIDVLTPQGLALTETDGAGWTRTDSTDVMSLLDDRGIDAVASLGWHLTAGRAAHDWAARRGAASTVVQHDVLTPYAPPLPPESTLFAWTSDDGDFYRSGRDDVDVRVIGSQVLWQAAREARHDGAPTPSGHTPPVGASTPGSNDAETADAAAIERRPVFLGQMHSPELPRRLTTGAAYSFCRREGALYRPHPSETDALSRATHALMRRRGIEVQDIDVPLRSMDNPVVSVVSTGVLDAAVRGIPAWVYAPGAPTWVEEFWDRYRMSRWGTSTPTDEPDIPADEPARLLAQHLEGVA